MEFHVPQDRIRIFIPGFDSNPNGCFNHQLVNEPLNCTWFVTIPDDLDRFEEPVEEPSSFMREPEEASTKACDLWAKKSRWFYYPG